MVDHSLARSFESIGEDYDRYRPGFPTEAADFLVPADTGTALDLGAGTGKFTGLLQGRARRVIAVEPSATMLDVLRRTFPAVEAMSGSAERIPIADASVDIVCVAQAFHWFDREAASAEIGRVLVRGGTLGLIWNRADPACAWDVACHRIAHPAVQDADDTTNASATALSGFELEATRVVSWTERISRENYLRRWSTVSSFLVATGERRDVMMNALSVVLDEDADTRGRSEFDLPHLTDVFRYRRV